MLLPHPLPDHPRLLARAEKWATLRRQIESDDCSRTIWRTLRHRADGICTEPPLARTLTGRMLLMISRQALERISVLAMVDRLSGEPRYGARAIDELMSICRFSDWNPSHFLDTAELCLAVSIGYDWLHDRLSPEQRDVIAGALIDKAITPSLDVRAVANWWLTTDENWAQVCHAGLSAGAIVIADRVPDLAEAVLSRAVSAIPRVAASYAPDGAYPEGPMYWSYGTSYHVVLAAALESLTGSTQGVDSYPGFAESAQYVNSMTAPSGEYFNYADCAARRRLQVQLFWMSDRYGHPEWLSHDLAMLENDLDEYRREPSVQYWYYDMVALALLWRKPGAAEAAARPSFWAGGGKVPIAVYRWGESNCFLGVKGGVVGLSHSHMDVGSFVFEASGVRWAVDTGMQDYANLEAAGVDLWNERQQDSGRWQVFRIGPESHNILRIENRAQLLFQSAPFSAGAEGCAVDIGGLYGEPLTSASRRFELHAAGFSIEDSWTATSPVEATSQWLTFAAVEQSGPSVVLRQNGKTLRLDVSGTSPVSIDIENLGHPVRWFDAPNPGFKRIAVRCRDAASGSIRVRASAA
ncbi:MAG: heparinase II/III family protein [Devosia sp.]|nr:heparinase II/III family protein [Devosia sp.]